MTAVVSPIASSPTDLGWRLVGLVNLYRLLLPPVLLALRAATAPHPEIGGARPQLFLAVCALYLGLGIGLVIAERASWSTPRVRMLVHVCVDSAAIALIVYASGGVSSGLGILLIVPIGALALLSSGRDALLGGAIGAIALLLQQIVGHLGGTAPATDYPAAGVLGAVIFLAVLLAVPLANRLRESEALVQRKELDLANLAELSQYIVQHLRESILVIDAQERIRLINESAAQMLGDRHAFPGVLLGEASPRLFYLLSLWRQSRSTPTDAARTFTAADGARVIQPHFAPLGSADPAPVLIFLEDTSLLAEKVQLSKLAALGRLSASIAHEIRNPVGAMSHAGQLLAESPQLGEQDRRLTSIIRANADRVSGIIDNVLQMSRREAPRMERLELGPWLEDFRAEFCETMQWRPERLRLELQAERVLVRADPAQLRQVLWNLCDNAVKHGLRGAADGIVEIHHGRLAQSGRPFVEIADRGAGIPAADTERIFEPFFSSAQGGTGLGLFLAREIAQTNGATLLYEPRPGGGSLFRIVFADPRRWEL